ncbi:acetyl-CoA hydrolase/transferase C-terminal domain-containing protein [Nocardia jinanensis]|uniref:Acetyl-CoA hydrolase n=1 Tax=Nocardia jinanensis TaxID=382504 RepID=A0A917RL68_9NOCA|nr:acetyl-CoA hydrolase/transferase C-terminal domain-containing protein [Nocardia jinanensis]GGL13663.1 acetyl-CoA hydrolase [Nocardia jinanensis]
MTPTRTATLATLVGAGDTVAVGDGFGAPRALSRELTAVAAELGDLRLVLGWVPEADPELDAAEFADARTFMPGWGLRTPVAAGRVRSVPVRLSATPALLHGPLRPDVLVASVVQTPEGFRFGNEISWQHSAVAAGARIAALVSRGAPSCATGPVLPPDRVYVVGETDDPPLDMPEQPATAEIERMVERLLAYIPAGARLQVGPGALGATVLRELTVPVRLDSGLLPDSVVDLDARGLLLDTPITTYLAGGPRLRAWAEGRELLHPVEVTHDLGRLSASPLFAVNTAVELDIDGQVNVEGTEKAIVGGIGGHPDYAAAAARSVGGLSIIAVTTTHRGRSTLVPRLSRPVSTPAHDVDVVVTEHGVADLRGLDRAERTEALLAAWGPAGVREV